MSEWFDDLAIDQTNDTASEDNHPGYHVADATALNQIKDTLGDRTDLLGAYATLVLRLAANDSAVSVRPRALAQQGSGPSLTGDQMASTARLVTAATTITGGTLTAHSRLVATGHVQIVNDSGGNRTYSIVGQLGASTVTSQATQNIASGNTIELTFRVLVHHTASGTQSATVEVVYQFSNTSATRITSTAWTEVTTGDVDFDLKIVANNGTNQTAQLKQYRLAFEPAP